MFNISSNYIIFFAQKLETFCGLFTYIAQYFDEFSNNINFCTSLSSRDVDNALLRLPGFVEEKMNNCMLQTKMEGNKR